MFLLADLLFALIRILILLFTTLLSYYLGSTLYHSLNTYLYANSIPCIELVSFLISTVPVLFVFYGISVKKYFWQRPGHYNLIILLISYCVGLIVSFMPVNALFAFNGTINPCPEQVTFTAKLIHALAAGILTSLLAFFGMDLGVSLKHLSHRVRRIGSKKKYR